ncbi:septum formation initiator family protein [Candidatus Microgenomates bacterium]|nr:septum formation initiator family protein [Candidatus Microgenomates bacterium]
MWHKLRLRITGRSLINLLALLIIGYLGVATIQVIGRNYNLQQEVDALQDEIAYLELKNQELGYQTAYYKTDAFADREARDKLGLQAPGEKVVIFSDKIPRGIADNTGNEPTGRVEAAIDNFQQWLYFLFRKEPS